MEPNQTKCELAAQVVSHPAYKYATFYTFIVSLLAVPGLLYFMRTRLQPLPFHGNLKSLLVVFFSATLVYDLYLCFAFGYQFFVPMLATSACDLIIDPVLFKYGHIVILIFIPMPMIVTVGFTIERFVAIGMAHKYEKTRTALGPVLALILIAIDITSSFYICWNETFSDNFVSFLLIPSTSAQKLNTYFLILLFLDIFNLFCNCTLLFTHKYLKNRYLRQKSSLSLRYVMEEIFQSSKFTLIVSFVNLLFFCVYLVSTLIVRTVGQSFFNGYVNYTVARSIYTAIPTNNLLIVFIGYKSLRHLNTRRHTKIQKTVRIKSTGTEGAKNYDDAISKHWDHVYTKYTKMKPAVRTHSSGNTLRIGLHRDAENNEQATTSLKY